jgi:hypothetical protein
MGSIRTFIQRLWERCEQTVTVSAPVKTKKREIRVLRVVTVLDWDGQRLTVVLVVSAMMDEIYGWEWVLVGEAGWKEHSRKNGPKFKLHEILKNIWMNLYFLAREKIKRKHWAGECGEFRFGDKSLKPDIRTTDRNPLAKKWECSCGF